MADRLCYERWNTRNGKFILPNSLWQTFLPFVLRILDLGCFEPCCSPHWNNPLEQPPFQLSREAILTSPLGISTYPSLWGRRCLRCLRKRIGNEKTGMACWLPALCLSGANSQFLGAVLAALPRKRVMGDLWIVWQEHWWVGPAIWSTGLANTRGERHESFI